MTGYRTILACLSDADTASATLGLALLVGRNHAAHVDALHVRIDPSTAIPLVGEGMSGAMVEEMLALAEKQASERAKGIRAQFDRICAQDGVTIAEVPLAEPQLSALWREELGREEEVVAEIGRLSDLLVLARPLPENEVPSIMTLNAALMESGRPLLLAPPVLPAIVGRKVAVFWNGSIEAARAVGAALPFLCQADEVFILSAREEAATSPGALVKYLAWHGISSVKHCFPAAGATGGQVAQILLDEAVTRGADMVVMGAYTHSRLRQLIMGGVTRHVLHYAKLPVLLCH